MRVDPLLVSLLTLGASGCFTMNAELPGVLRNDLTPADHESLGAFTVEGRHWFLIDGLFGKPPRDLLAADIRAAVQKRGGDGATGLSYESEHTCGDTAIGTCTLGCLVPRSYRIKGTVVRIRAPRLPGRPAKLVDAVPLDVDTRVAQRF
ncbi:MAG: hypothetical protein A2138_11645 [Deltaproteobacteria bacterium RBG_16_71_12]|nr:MAG: hypothetical protein A2138_11645 [Deltaproteobacteria bacterium RBG_16_71_12]